MHKSNKENQENQKLYLPSKIFKENSLFFVIIFFTVLILYGNTYDGQFLTADDIPGIVNNPMVKDFEASMASWELEKILPAIIFKLFGMNPSIFHIFSIFMHIVNSVLVFLFVFVIFGKELAVVSTLVFMVHPINSEAVSWISAYGYLVYTALTLLTLLYYFLWAKTRDKKYLAVSLAVYIAAILFYRKPWVVLIPLFLFILDQMVIELKPTLKKWKVYMLYAIPTLMYLAIYVRNLLSYRAETLVTLYYNDPERATPYFNRVLYTTYMTIKLFLYPKDLTIYHEGEKVYSIESFTVLSGIATLLMIILIVVLLKKGYQKNKPSITARYAAAMILLIYSSILLSYYYEVLVWAMAERYLYLGSVFFGVLVALIYKKYSKTSWALPVLVILLSLLSLRTIVRTNAWKNSKNLWIATQKVSPYSYRVYNNLGDVYSEEGNLPEAIRNFQISLQLYPEFADAVHNLGYSYYQAGDIEQAKNYLAISLEMNPNLYQASYKLGVIAAQQNDPELAIEYFERTLRINPDFTQAADAIALIRNVITSPPTSLPPPQ